MHADELSRLLQSANRDDTNSLNRLMVDASLHLPEAQTSASFAGDTEDLLGLWMEGTPIHEIAVRNVRHRRLGGTVVPVYRRLVRIPAIPWIISGLLRIARESLVISDNETSEYVRSYPAMVKHGLPDPVAAWAMSAGIATRGIALRLAEAFQRETSDVASHEGFVTWLSGLSDDSLFNDYGISGYALEDLRFKRSEEWWQTLC